MINLYNIDCMEALKDMEEDKKKSYYRRDESPNCRSCNGIGWITAIPVEYLCRECNGSGVQK